METYKAELWKLNVYNDVIAMTHGFYKEIKEIYVPDRNIAINFVDEVMHCFTSSSSRYEDSKSKPKKLGEFEIDGEVVQAAVEYLESKFLLEEWLSECVIEDESCNGISPKILLSKNYKFK